MRKIKWGVLGTANIARNCTIPGMRLAENCELYAVAGRSLEKAEHYRDEFGFGKAYGSYEALLADPAVEAVYVPLPNSLHKEWTIRALRAKKHVLCEKPLAPTAAEAEEMFREAETNGVLLMEAFAYLHSPLTAAIKADLDSGAIGDVLYLENAFITSDYDVSDIRMRRETFGGSLYDLGCYCVSQALWLLGEPDSVKAAAVYTDRSIDRYTTGVLSYGDGKQAAFSCGMVLATNRGRRIDRLQIHGTKGMIRCDAEYNQMGELCYTIDADGAQTIRTVSASQNYSLEVAQLGRCITEGETPWVSREFSLAEARTMDKVLAAIGY